MNKEDLMRISRALALFRPSVLASMINLTEDDLVFTEKCLQRTLLVTPTQSALYKHIFILYYFI
jgi:hypothetical protein